MQPSTNDLCKGVIVIAFATLRRGRIDTKLSSIENCMHLYFVDFYVCNV